MGPGHAEAACRQEHRPAGCSWSPGSALARVSQPKKVWAPSQGGAAGTERPQSPPPSPRLWPRPPVRPSGRGRSGTWSELCTARGHPLRTARRAARRAAHVELRDADVMEPRAGGGGEGGSGQVRGGDAPSRLLCRRAARGSRHPRAAGAISRRAAHPQRPELCVLPGSLLRLSCR